MNVIKLMVALSFVGLLSTATVPLSTAYADQGAAGSCNVVPGQRHRPVCDPLDVGTQCVRLIPGGNPPGVFGTCTTFGAGTETSRCECVPNATTAQIVQIDRVKDALSTASLFDEVSQTLGTSLACSQITVLAAEMLAAQVVLSSLGPIEFFDAKTLGKVDFILLNVLPFASRAAVCSSTFPSDVFTDFFIDVKNQLMSSAVSSSTTF